MFEFAIAPSAADLANDCDVFCLDIGCFGVEVKVAALVEVGNSCPASDFVAWLEVKLLSPPTSMMLPSHFMVSLSLGSMSAAMMVGDG